MTALSDRKNDSSPIQNHVHEMGESMKYAKPEVALIGLAVSVVHSLVSIKFCCFFYDGLTTYATHPAYEADE